MEQLEDESNLREMKMMQSDSIEIIRENMKLDLPKEKRAIRGNICNERVIKR